MFPTRRKRLLPVKLSFFLPNSELSFIFNDAITQCCFKASLVRFTRWVQHLELNRRARLALLSKTTSSWEILWFTKLSAAGVTLVQKVFCFYFRCWYNQNVSAEKYVTPHKKFQKYCEENRTSFTSEQMIGSYPREQTLSRPLCKRCSYVCKLSSFPTMQLRNVSFRDFLFFISFIIL